MRKIYLFLPTDDYGEKIFQNIENEKVKFLKIKKIYKKFLRVYFSYKISRYINLPFKFKIFKNVLKINKLQDSEQNYFIFFDNTPWMIDNRFIYILKKKYPKSKIILYLWNTLDKVFYEKIKKFTFDKIITFDKQDSIKYDFEYYPQVHSRKLLEKYKNTELTEEVIFIGKDKDRIKILNNIFQFLEKLKIGPNYFYIVKDKKKYSRDLYIYNSLYNEYLSYEIVLKKLSSSRVILDVTKENQEGLTLRVLESLFLNKKVITNNLGIKKYEFYNKNNIYILEENNIDLKEFLKKEYININEDIKNKYDVNSWFNFILNNI